MALTSVPDRACSGVMIWTLPLLASRVAFGYKAREHLRAVEAHKSLLGPIPKHVRLPGKGPFVAMLAACQFPKLFSGFGLRDGLASSFQGVPIPLGQSLRLAQEYFLDHL